MAIASRSPRRRYGVELGRPVAARVVSAGCLSPPTAVGLRYASAQVRAVLEFGAAMTSSAFSTGSARGGKILVYTRVLSAVIVPFLVLAFVVLYVFPDETARWFAWPIKATMTSMTLASAYLGGVYFFTRVALRERRWQSVRTGFVAVALFATLLGIATVVHWPLFSHDKLAFWLWAGLYLTTPFLVVGGWLANRRRAGRGSADGPLLDLLPARAIGLVGGLALAQGIVL